MCLTVQCEIMLHVNADCSPVTASMTERMQVVSVAVHCGILFHTFVLVTININLNMFCYFIKKISVVCSSIGL